MPGSPSRRRHPARGVTLTGTYERPIWGRRLLLSTSGDGTAAGSDSVAWSLLPDQRVELATWIEAERQDYPGSVRRATTLREALDLVVPGLPPTDVAHALPGGPVPASAGRNRRAHRS